jgi:hypothetical protein
VDAHKQRPPCRYAVTTSLWVINDFIANLRCDSRPRHATVNCSRAVVRFSVAYVTSMNRVTARREWRSLYPYLQVFSLSGVPGGQGFCSFFIPQKHRQAQLGKVPEASSQYCSA